MSDGYTLPSLDFLEGQYWLSWVNKWLKEETHNQKDMSSNRATGYWVDIFTH